MAEQALLSLSRVLPNIQALTIFGHYPYEDEEDDRLVPAILSFRLLHKLDVSETYICYSEALRATSVLQTRTLLVDVMSLHATDDLAFKPLESSPFLSTLNIGYLNLQEDDLLRLFRSLTNLLDLTVNEVKTPSPACITSALALIGSTLRRLVLRIDPDSSSYAADGTPDDGYLARMPHLRDAILDSRFLPRAQLSAHIPASLQKLLVHRAPDCDIEAR